MYQIADLYSGIKNNYTGYNIYFEPEYHADDEDGIQFAQFVDRVARALHAKGLKLLVKWVSQPLSGKFAYQKN